MTKLKTEYLMALLVIASFFLGFNGAKMTEHDVMIYGCLASSAIIYAAWKALEERFDIMSSSLVELLKEKYYSSIEKEQNDK